MAAIARGCSHGAVAASLRLVVLHGKADFLPTARLYSCAEGSGTVFIWLFPTPSLFSFFHSWSIARGRIIGTSDVAAVHINFRLNFALHSSRFIVEKLEFLLLCAHKGAGFCQYIISSGLLTRTCAAFAYFESYRCSFRCCYCYCNY